jgi:hypothetical protein
MMGCGTSTDSIRVRLHIQTEPEDNHQPLSLWLQRMIYKYFLATHKAGELERYRYPLWMLWERPRFSINAICWSGEDLAAVGGAIDKAEEDDITVGLPHRLNRYNAICGRALVAHFAFWSQREYLDRGSLLEEYKRLAVRELGEGLGDR